MKLFSSVVVGAIAAALVLVEGKGGNHTKCRPTGDDATPMPATKVPTPPGTMRPSPLPTSMTPTSVPTKAPSPPSGPTQAPSPPSGPTQAPSPPSGPTKAPSSLSPSSAPSSAPTKSPSPSSSSGFAQYFTEAQFREVFPQAHALYTFDGLVAAAAKYPSFANSGDATADKRELAAFLAQTSHESDHFKATEEYAKDQFPETQYCDKSNGVPCAAGKRYHGRGPIQLSWNYNYNAAGKALGVDLLNQPELVAIDKSVTWQTALWYWMMPQRGGRVIHDVVAKDDGFAQSTDIINGALECGAAATAKNNEKQRIEYYKSMCAKLGVAPVKKMSCNE
ncbi:hypothetical protein P43SY_000292 [Pythium insidiosum]|uniref:Glycoside hydrolase family 19 catalytic domain-containing protein n=1 Tax=Pythium insidiosum TaxID=114742 RepID=A0AAD5LGI3_PYTIN|nr:hypothetical protein P43SY_000292 [Pythium insidiosum]